MLPILLLRVAASVAAMGVVVATLPNGDVERSLFTPTPDGVQATVEHQASAADVRTLQHRFLPRSRYTWRIEEERRTILMAEPGRPTGTVRRAFTLGAWIDATPNPNVAPHPTEAFQFYAPTREAAEALRDRLKAALGGRR